MAWNGTGFLNPLELSMIQAGSGAAADQFKGQGVQTRVVQKFVGDMPVNVTQILEPSTGQWADATDNGDGTFGTSTNTRTSYGWGIDNAAAGGRINPTDNDQVARRIDNRYASNGSGGYNFDGSNVVDYADKKDTTAQFLMRAIPAIGLSAFGMQSLLPGIDAMGNAVAANTGPLSWGGLTHANAGGSNFSQGFTDGGTAGGALDSTYAGNAGVSYSAGADGINQLTGEAQKVGPDFSQGFTDSGTAGGALDTTYANPSLTTGAGTSVLKAGGSGFMDSLKGLVPDSIKPFVVPAVTAALSYAGSKPATSTGGLSNPDIGNFFGGSLMPGLTDLLHAQAPRAAESSGLLAQQARGLLGAPVAGNGFNLLTGGRYGR